MTSPLSLAVWTSLWVSATVKMENLLKLSAETLAKIDEVVPKYPQKRSAALMVIHLVQDELGAVDDHRL